MIFLGLLTCLPGLALANGIPIVYDNFDAFGLTIGDIDTAFNNAPRLADDFTLDDTYQITDLHWMGAYGRFEVPEFISLESFWFKIWEQNENGFNDYFTTTASFGNFPGEVTRIDTGRTFDIAGEFGPVPFDIYEYQLDIDPIILNAGTYLFQVQLSDNIDWFWLGNGMGLNGEYLLEDDLVTWTLMDDPATGRYFQLTGEVASVPEPSTLILLGTGLVSLAGFRRRFQI